MQEVSAFETRERNTFSVGILIGLASWTLIFITLVWGYVVYRLRTAQWLGEFITSNVVSIAILNTVVLLVSSWALSKSFKTDTARPKFLAWAAFGFGCVFLAGQCVLWQLSMANGLRWTDSIAGSFFYLLTGFHALHIVGALMAVFMLCLKYESWQRSLIASGIKNFWDSLLVVWLVMFILIFIVK